jgi:hypothetical protein
VRRRYGRSVKSNNSNWLPWILIAAAGGIYVLAGDGGAQERLLSSSDHVYFRRCAEARAAGVAPIYEGEPGYRPELDRDSDGIACEPYRGQ